MSSPLRDRLRSTYFWFLDQLHHPFVRPGNKDPYHGVLAEFLSLAKSLPSPAVLEIGSRNVTGITRRGLFPESGEYVGFDILAGEGVDVVGDVHRLSEHFPAGHFDLVLSVSVFEHLLFPWKAVLEINKVLKLGGCLHVSTHPVYPPHELPWDFWRFPGNSFHALFNRHTGFELLTLTEGLPCRAYSLVDDAPTRDLWRGTMNLGVALIARKTGDYRADRLKWDIDVQDVVSTMYPQKNP